MKERGIIFSAPMVRALIAGTKTQTRRLIKPEWLRCLDLEDEADRAAALAQSPYQANGRLWVRETWAGFHAPDGSGSGVVYRATCRPDDTFRWVSEADADGCFAVADLHVDRWRPSIHMPRWASRLTLEITSVRVERLGDISEADAEAEGLSSSTLAGQPFQVVEPDGTVRQSTWAWTSCAYAFAHLWSSIHGDGAWERDRERWVWVIGFRRVEG